MGKYGYNTMLIDIDTQCNSNSGVGINYIYEEESIYDIPVAGKNPNGFILDTPFKNLKILPSKSYKYMITGVFVYWQAKKFDEMIKLRESELPR